MNEREFREHIAFLGASIFDRGLTHGRTGNISVRLDDGILITPTSSCLGRLQPGRISRLDPEGALVDGDQPSKEAFLHLAMYESRPAARAIVHLHSTYSVAVSCLADIDHDNVLPPLTAYYAMRVGRLPLVPYYPPGDPMLAEAIGQAGTRSRAMLLANHGPLLAAQNLDAAVDGIEELEQTARLHLLLQGHPTRPLSDEQLRQLQSLFPAQG